MIDVNDPCHAELPFYMRSRYGLRAEVERWSILLQRRLMSLCIAQSQGLELL